MLSFRKFTKTVDASLIPLKITPFTLPILMLISPIVRGVMHSGSNPYLLIEADV